MATNKPKARGKVKPSPVADPEHRDIGGPYVHLLRDNRAQHFQHWNKAKSNGHVRDTANRFLELEREGIASLYAVLRDLAREVYGPMSVLFLGGPVSRSVWEGMGQEYSNYVSACSRNDGKDPKLGVPYGETYARAHYRKIHPVYAPHTVTAEEAERHNASEREDESPGWPAGLIEEGQVQMRVVPELSANALAEEVGNGWVALFFAEVDALLGKDPDADGIAALRDLHRNLTAYEIGAAEGAQTMARLRAESMGRTALAAFDRCRSGLLRLLDELVREHSSAAETSGQTCKWLGTPGELCQLFQTLVQQQWIPEQRGKVARFMASVFVTSNGEPFNAGTFETWMKRSNAPPVRTDVDFTATENPEKV